jgi:hypothetical protein
MGLNKINFLTFRNPQKVNFVHKYLRELVKKYEIISCCLSGAYEVLIHQQNSRPNNIMLQFLY